jgi:lipid A 3-O-deacylase
LFLLVSLMRTLAVTGISDKRSFNFLWKGSLMAMHWGGVFKAVVAAWIVVLPIAVGSVQATERGILSLQLENDGVVQMDRHYTHGMQLSYFPLGQPPSWAVSTLDGLGLDPHEGEVAVEYALGHTIFTPEDFENPAPQPDERPWAGHTYFSLAVMRKPEQRQTLLQSGDKIKLTLGHVGPHSGAASAQKRVHALIGSAEPQGWQHQIGNETTLNLHYFRKWMFYQETPSGRDIELSPLLGVALGSPYTYASAGLSLRWGADLQRDFGPPSIQPNYPGSSYFQPGTPWNWYLMAGAEYRYVLYNLFLDGPLFRDGPSVDKYRDVGDLFVGGAVSYQKVRLSYMTVYRSKEFRGQEARDIFGSLNLSFYF